MLNTETLANVQSQSLNKNKKKLFKIMFYNKDSNKSTYFLKV